MLVVVLLVRAVHTVNSYYYTKITSENNAKYSQ